MVKEEDRGDYVEDDDYEELDSDTTEDSDDEDSESDEEVLEGEGEDESEEEEDDSDDSEGDDEDAEEEESGSGQKVPISRLNRVLSQRDRERDRVEWLEDQLERLLEHQVSSADPKGKVVDSPSVYDFEEAETKYADLLIEGETSKAAKLRNEINKRREEDFQSRFNLLREELADAVVEGASTSVDEDRFNTLVENFENKYSFLDIESDDYNEEAVETVNNLMVGFMTESNMTKSKAITQAVKKIAPMYEKPGPKETSKRDQKARKRNVKAMKQTPAKMRGKHNRVRDVSDLDLEKLSDREYGKLTAREKAKLRGDFVG